MQQIETKKELADLVFNPGSERNIISICLKDNDKLLEVKSANIFADHFSVPGHRFIFMAMLYLFSKNTKITPTAIFEVLSTNQAKEAVKELGGLDYLIILTATNTSPDNLDIFIEKLKQSYTRKMLLNISQNIHSFVISEKAEILNPSELLHYAINQLDDLKVNILTTEDAYKMGDNTEEILNERADNPSQIPGLEIGWLQYDTLTNGAQPGDLIIICAPSKVGKSVMLTNWATKLSIIDQIPILYFDTEMEAREQEDRILANLTGIPHSEIISGMYVMDTVNGKAKEKLPLLKSAREKLNLGHYYHIYMPFFTIEKINTLSSRFINQFGVKSIFFDYIKIPSNQADFKTMKEYQALGFFTSGLKDLAGTLEIPIFTACQTNRSNLGTNEPDASVIGGSYRILQLASKLIFLVDKSDEQIAKEGFHNGNQQLFIKYQRSGASNCDPINILFKRHILRQEEC